MRKVCEFLSECKKKIVACSKKYLKCPCKDNHPRLIKLNKADYFKRFGVDITDCKKDCAKPSESRLYRAYHQAWDARKVEVDNYWKRTTYMWAFQAAALVAYFASLKSTHIKIPNENTEILFIIIALGLLTSVTWYLMNKGSKFWQRHWDKHITMLEDYVTGPLYKTIYNEGNKATYSVSKINEMIPLYFIFVWLGLAIKYSIDNLTINGDELALFEIFITSFVLYACMSMLCGKGRGRFGSKDFEFYKHTSFKEETESDKKTES